MGWLEDDRASFWGPLALFSGALAVSFREGVALWQFGRYVIGSNSRVEIP